MLETKVVNYLFRTFLKSSQVEDTITSFHLIQKNVKLPPSKFCSVVKMINNNENIETSVVIGCLHPKRNVPAKCQVPRLKPFWLCGDRCKVFDKYKVDMGTLEVRSITSSFNSHYISSLPYCIFTKPTTKVTFTA